MKRAFIVLAVIVTTMAVTVGPAGAAKRAKVRRPGPLRVVLAGDSITEGYASIAAAALAAKGYQVTTAGLSGTGLLDAEQCKGQVARSLLLQADPDVVIYENVGNFQNGKAPCAGVTAKNFLTRWARSAARVQKILTRRGARFLWVLAPAAVLEPGATRIPQTNAIYATLAPTIDAWSAFGGAVYNPSLHSDGLHLNDAGAQRLADLVVAAIG